MTGEVSRDHELVDLDDQAARLYGYGDRPEAPGGLDDHAAFRPADVVLGAVRRQLTSYERRAMRYQAMVTVELPEHIQVHQAGSLDNPHIVDPNDIPGTAPRGPGASAKGYFRYAKQHGEANA